ncbi:MAG TPA: AAA family ATPase [Candidatus Choladousia intestinigallinarum]|nr:AAA family ATPase [Candidatus Choladousia intestinigallinarum]
MSIRILYTADWHIGTPKSPYKDGINIRSQDTLNCLDEMIRVAAAEKPDYSLVSGDIFDKAEIGQGRGHKEVLQARHYILGLSKNSGQVIVMRGTPNHDSQEAFEELAAHFEHIPNVHIVMTPGVLSFGSLDVAILPGFDRGAFRASHPGLSKDEENEVFTQEISNIVMGLRAQCRPDVPAVLMSHYTVPGSNTESGQLMMLTQFEPVIPVNALKAANYDLVALGHIHRPQRVPGIQNCFYSGAINSMNFGDEGQERGFWIHEHDTPWDTWNWESRFFRTPYREFITLHFTETDVAAINLGHLDEVALNHWRWDGAVQGKMVRIRYSCPADQAKAYRMKESLVEKTLLEDGALMLWDNLPENISEFANKEELAETTDPEVNLIRYLEEKQIDQEKIQDLVLKARGIIAQAEASRTAVVNTGRFEPIEISVKNYRNYEEQTFNFRDITFCTINGQNGAGKSSLFMDAVMDCLFEEPREGFTSIDGKSPWLRNDEAVKKGFIIFTFCIGGNVYRVTRSRARSGKGTLNVSQFIDGDWEDRSKERFADTQKEILNILGMDSFTFKSCALIMQDQYGIFLQAKPEERVEVLSTLLCLGIYQAMEKIADEKRKTASDKSRRLDAEIEMHDNTIRSIGDPREELEACSMELEILESRQKEKIAERDKNKLLLAQQKEAQERRRKLSNSVADLTVRKMVAEESKVAQQKILESNLELLSAKDQIEAAVSRYNVLSENERELSQKVALHAGKVKEARTSSQEAEAEQTYLAGLQAEARELKAQRDALQPTAEDNRTRAKAQEYEKYRELYQHSKELQAAHQAAVSKRDQVIHEYEKKRANMEGQIAVLRKERTDLERRTQLLENSGCPDLNNARCRFLSDALEAREKIPGNEKDINELEQKLNAILEESQKKYKEAYEDIESVGFDPQILEAYRKKMDELSDAPQALIDLDAREKQIAVIEAKLEAVEGNIDNAKKKLSEAKLRAEMAKKEAEQSADIQTRYDDLIKELDILRPMLERERQIPIAEERVKTATARIGELTEEISRLDGEIREIKKELSEEAVNVYDAEKLNVILAELDKELERLTSQMKDKQMRIGSLQSKAEQAEKLRSEVFALSKQHIEAAVEATDYETLKAAFSQSGIPHQIIRSIIPQITDTANSILGQMTGGKMGVEFHLERMQKNGKEKTSLDVFVDEYGKAPLPYLSKSGGEKVKSSLAVILALAEVKSSLAGMQMGMLFIDEPPFLDADGTQAYCDALETIWQRYPGTKLMAITHDDSFKARFPQSVDVVKTDNGSKVVC